MAVRAEVVRVAVAMETAAQAQGVAGMARAARAVAELMAVAHPGRPHVHNALIARPFEHAPDRDSQPAGLGGCSILGRCERGCSFLCNCQKEAAARRRPPCSRATRHTRSARAWLQGRPSERWMQ